MLLFDNLYSNGTMLGQSIAEYEW